MPGTVINGKEYTPDPMSVEDIEANALLVVGTNTEGQHYGGAARFAHDKLGLEWGVSEGPSGMAYGFPTLHRPNTLTDEADRDDNRVSEQDMLASFEMLRYYAMANPNIKIYLTKVGGGIAGWDITTVARLFWQSEIPHTASNVVYPIEFEVVEE